MNSFNRWDIWLADVQFEDSADKKKRPVVVLSDENVFVLSLKMTSHDPRYSFCEGEFELLKWGDAGLSKPTVVRCSKALQISKDDMIIKIGRLDKADINGICVMLKYLNKKI